MIRKGLILTPTKNMSREDWLKERDRGIGGSDMSSIMGLNKNFSAIQLFYQKIGFTGQSQEINEAMHWGTRHEQVILDHGQYIDVDTGQYLDNLINGRKLRSISPFQYMVVNRSHPWIIANLDGAVNVDKKRFLIDAIAEAKSISRQTADIWVNRIPPYHIIQISTYMAVCKPIMRGLPSAFLFYLEDGSRFRAFHVEHNSLIEERILEESYKFWGLIQQGRDIMANVKDPDRRLELLADIQPSPDSTEYYESFLSDLYKKKLEYITLSGEEYDLDIATAFSELKKQEKELGLQMQEVRNKIVERMYKESANKIILPNNSGIVTYNGTRLNVRVNAN